MGGSTVDDGGEGSGVGTVGRLQRVCVAACVGLVVFGTAAVAAADPLPVTGVGMGAEQSVVSGVVDSGNLSATTSFIQLPFAESFPSWSGGRGPRVVLLSYNTEIDSLLYPERIRTLRSVDGGKTFIPLAASVPIESMKQLADGSLVTIGFRTTAAAQSISSRPATGARRTSGRPGSGRRGPSRRPARTPPSTSTGAS
jgi:hypothetical protein